MILGLVNPGSERKESEKPGPLPALPGSFYPRTGFFADPPGLLLSRNGLSLVTAREMQPLRGRDP